MSQTINLNEIVNSVVEHEVGEGSLSNVVVSVDDYNQFKFDQEDHLKDYKRIHNPDTIKIVGNTIFLNGDNVVVLNDSNKISTVFETPSEDLSSDTDWLNYFLEQLNELSSEIHINEEEYDPEEVYNSNLNIINTLSSVISSGTPPEGMSEEEYDDAVWLYNYLTTHNKRSSDGGSESPYNEVTVKYFYLEFEWHNNSIIVSSRRFSDYSVRRYKREVMNKYRGWRANPYLTKAYSNYQALDNELNKIDSIYNKVMDLGNNVYLYMRAPEYVYQQTIDVLDLYINSYDARGRSVNAFRPTINTFYNDPTRSEFDIVTEIIRQTPATDVGFLEEVFHIVENFRRYKQELSELITKLSNSKYYMGSSRELTARDDSVNKEDIDTIQLAFSIKINDGVMERKSLSTTFGDIVRYLLNQKIVKALRKDPYSRDKYAKAAKDYWKQTILSQMENIIKTRLQKEEEKMFSFIGFDSDWLNSYLDYVMDGCISMALSGIDKKTLAVDISEFNIYEFMSNVVNQTVVCETSNLTRTIPVMNGVSGKDETEYQYRVGLIFDNCRIKRVDENYKDYFKYVSVCDVMLDLASTYDENWNIEHGGLKLCIDKFLKVDYPHQGIVRQTMSIVGETEAVFHDVTYETLQKDFPTIIQEDQNGDRHSVTYYAICAPTIKTINVDSNETIQTVTPYFTDENISYTFNSHNYLAGFDNKLERCSMLMDFNIPYKWMSSDTDNWSESKRWFIDNIREESEWMRETIYVRCTPRFNENFVLKAIAYDSTDANEPKYLGTHTINLSGMGLYNAGMLNSYVCKCNFDNVRPLSSQYLLACGEPRVWSNASSSVINLTDVENTIRNEIKTFIEPKFDEVINFSSDEYSMVHVFKGDIKDVYIQCNFSTMRPYYKGSLGTKKYPVFNLPFFIHSTEEGDLSVKIYGIQKSKPCPIVSASCPDVTNNLSTTLSDFPEIPSELRHKNGIKYYVNEDRVVYCHALKDECASPSHGDSDNWIDDVQLSGTTYVSEVYLCPYHDRELAQSFVLSYLAAKAAADGSDDFSFEYNGGYGTRTLKHLRDNVFKYTSPGSTAIHVSPEDPGAYGDIMQEQGHVSQTFVPVTVYGH